eukprot:360709-Chlamydomonas_euryale.AAC.3
MHACQVRVLRYDAEEERLDSVRALHHANEVWSIAPSPEDTRRLVTVWSKCELTLNTLSTLNNEMSLGPPASSLSLPPPLFPAPTGWHISHTCFFHVRHADPSRPCDGTLWSIHLNKATPVNNTQ